MPITSILSTKVLNSTHRALFEDANIQLTDYNAISIERLPFHTDMTVENAIITSQNAAKAVIEKQVDIKNCFCVGEKTKALLEQHGYKVVVMKHNASELAYHITINHRANDFVFYCGNLRQRILPDTLQQNHISLKEITVYNTNKTPKKIEGNFDGILFYSPSGVHSYLEENSIGNETIFCIGTTTANAIKQHTKNIVVPSSPTIENLLQQVVKYSENND